MDHRNYSGRSIAATVRAIVSGLVVLALGSPAFAGLADSPLPILTPGGATAKYMYTVPGVMKTGHVETEFTCTSIDKSVTFKFAVEVFGPAGGLPLNDVTTGNGVATLAPGATQTIATANTDGLHEDVLIDFGTGPRPTNGSARIVSESTHIVCTAFAVDKRGQHRCLSTATDPTKVGQDCLTDADCGSGSPLGACKAVPDSMLHLSILKGKTQHGE